MAAMGSHQSPYHIDQIVERFSHPPERVVSLVPSLTESLFDLGLNEALVGVTDFCVHPQGALQGLPRVGGTKNPRLEDVLALSPDLVLANQEENTPAVVRQLTDAGVAVWVSFPTTVQGALQVLRQLAELWHSSEALIRIETLERAVEWSQAAGVDRPRVRYFSPIWMEEGSAGEPWWMTFNRQTYIHDLLDLLGGANVFADRRRRYPLQADLGLGPPDDSDGRDTRYPRVTRAEILEADPDVILLPDEPFPFNARHSRRIEDYLSDVAAVREGRLLQVDGSLLSWHGTRLAKALRQLTDLFENPSS